MEIIFKSINITNFNNHETLLIQFDDITNIHGRNGAGKSSIGNAITWNLYGTDVFGTKLDPKPIGTDLETKVELLIQVDEKQILLGRTQKKTSKYYINEIPEKATKFNEFVELLFDKNLFLSLFTPGYFSSQHWQDQRTQLLQYVSEPLNKEVLAKLSEVKQNNLAEPLKKHSLDDLEKVHRDRYNKHDKAYERAAERVLTLQEQLKKYDGQNVDVSSLEKEINDLRKQRDKIDERNRSTYEANNNRSRIESKIESLTQQIKRQQQFVQSIKSETIQESCKTCGQALDDVSIQKVKDERQNRYNKAVNDGKELVQEYNQLQEQLRSLPKNIEIDRTESDVIDQKIMELHQKIKDVNQFIILKQEIEKAKEYLELIRNERNESQGIIEAIKDFRTKRSEMMVKKVDDLFTTISVNLFETLKNGEERATFEIVMDGKPYSKLSTAEKIRAGLELIEVLSKQSEVIAPTFVDNAESILNFTSPSGQLIVARVVDEELNIKTVSVKGEK